MKKQIRLDKYLSECSKESRSEVKNWLKKGRVTVNGQKEKDPGRKVIPLEDEICLDGIRLHLVQFHYLMMHKPAGLICATRDDREKTVLDLVMEQDWSQDPFGMAIYGKVAPVGRLDKDTEGLLLLTDDGDLAHRLLSPKKHVNKCYYAILDGPIGEEEIRAFEEGLDIGDEKKTMPALLEDLSTSSVDSFTDLATCDKDIEGYGVLIHIKEGRYHQVKRMAKAVGREVLYLKRLSMGSLLLDLHLKKGQCRPLTEEEIQELQKNS